MALGAGQEVLAEVHASRPRDLGDGVHDRLVARAAAEVAREQLLDLAPRRRAAGREQLGRRS